MSGLRLPYKALVQLRTAMGENEEFFEKLQEAHDDLAVRCVELEEQNANLRIEGEESNRRLSASLLMKRTSRAGISLRGPSGRWKRPWTRQTRK
jgi:hypothetical protein